MTNYPIDEALNANEKIISIDLINKVKGTTYPRADVLLENTLVQVLQEYAEDIGINPLDDKILFENKRTGQSTSDLGETVEGLGLRADDMLAITDNCGVAGEEVPFTIDLLNKANGLMRQGIPVLGENTLKQILGEYAADIGADPEDGKILFENVRGGKSTCNCGMTM